MEISKKNTNGCIKVDFKELKIMCMVFKRKKLTCCLEISNGNFLDHDIDDKLN